LRLVRAGTAPAVPGAEAAGPALRAAHDYCAWLQSSGNDPVSRRCRHYIEISPLGMVQDLPGPVGERNVYSLRARGRIAAMPSTETGLLLQIGAALATGNQVVLEPGAAGRSVLASLPASVAARIAVAADLASAGQLAGILFEGDAESLRALERKVAELPGALVAVHALGTDELARGVQDYPLHWLVEECSVSTNTAAAGGNASLMAIG
jgi:RHH-type proline utilization regulon transcriptional repressor/proline dehydrogenase/delta 1-pyrroline-5-carboxylate dehydrogenase